MVVSRERSWGSGFGGSGFLFQRETAAAEQSGAEWSRNVAGQSRTNGRLDTAAACRIPGRCFPLARTTGRSCYTPWSLTLHQI